VDEHAIRYRNLTLFNATYDAVEKATAERKS